MKKIRGDYGITLIALVITIIVMLILVAVTINISINGGLFVYARNASVETKQRMDEELEIANIASDKSVDELINYYTNRINFKIRYGSKTMEYTAEKGMTWKEWFQSNYYNSNGLDFDFCIPIQPGYTFPEGLHTTKELKKVQLDYFIDNELDSMVLLDDQIIENELYYMIILTSV